MKLVSILIVMVVILLAAASFVALRVTWKLTHPRQKQIDSRPEDFSIHHYEKISFPSRESGITIRGWYLSAKANGFPDRKRTLIFSHGYGQNRLEPHLPALSLAARLVSCGYNILMFDFRNSGESSPALTTIGLREQDDLLGAIDYVEKNRPSERIGLIGFSMGAATSLLVGGRDQRVEAIAADSPFYSLQEYLEENLPQWTGLPRFPFNWLILTLSPLMLGANPRHVRPYEAVTGANKPIFFIHGTGDATVPSANSEWLYQLAAHEESELWLVPGAGHVRSYPLVPEEYARKMAAFFERIGESSKAAQDGDYAKKPSPAR
ncbi:alpha/beta fold hydrolase [Brevibacillus ruminantium]|uniref:Alpha/beta fold hydrolase n=1 Tax=Brevibacillus ruminantium TaxID=2950604 RepID=A0ABY4WLU4_9BACL|nr:alpha/beta fold hydrolase [Brevibacillus ruminantium]USG66820.1 alpha/beta fold hydrolase [Brevibacillus ruminantium]